MSRCGIISLVGRPNVGKSTLTNCLTKDKIAAVSAKPQTTRNRIFGVLTEGDNQFVFMDTPGLIKPKNRLGDFMLKISMDAIYNVEAIALLVEPTPRVGVAEEIFIEKLKSSKIPVILVINKIDTIKREEILPIVDLYQEKLNFAAIIPISAKTGEGREQLLSEFSNYLSEGPFLFDSDQTTDQPEKLVTSEIIREKLLTYLDKEIPHGTAVEITRFAEREANDEIIDVEATIYCERDSHKGIIIGKGGKMLKLIGEKARLDIEAFMGVKVYLQLWVKVKENWRDSAHYIRNFGYE